MSGAITVNDFIRKWHAVELKERSAAQEHFLNLCRLLGEPSPAEADPTGDFYCFERAPQRRAAAKAGPMSGSAVTSAGNTRANARTSKPPSGSSSNMP
jgi:hypothetical protein